MSIQRARTRKFGSDLTGVRGLDCGEGYVTAGKDEVPNNRYWRRRLKAEARKKKK